MFVVSVVFSDGETNVSIDTIPADTIAPTQVTSLEIVATTLAIQSSLPKSADSNNNVVAAGLIGGAVVLSGAWWLMAVKGRPKPM